MLKKLSIRFSINRVLTIDRGRKSRQWITLNRKHMLRSIPFIIFITNSFIKIQIYLTCSYSRDCIRYVALLLVLFFSYLPFFPNYVMSYFCFCFCLSHKSYYKQKYIIMQTFYQDFFISMFALQWMSICMCICIGTISVQGFNITHKQIQLQVNQPLYLNIKNALNIQIGKQGQKINIKLPDGNFQISSQIYIHNGPLYDESLFNKGSYELKNNNVCRIFSTDIDTRQRAQTKFDQDMQIFKYFLSHKHKDKKSTFYILTTNSTLIKYIFDKINIKLAADYIAAPLISQMEGNRLSSNVQLLQLNSVLFLFTNQSVNLLDQKNIVNHFKSIKGYTPVDRLVSVGIIEQLQQQNTDIWICGGNTIYIYHVNYTKQDGTYELNEMNKLQGFTNDTILSIIYNNEDKKFYATSGTSMLIINPNSPQIVSYNINAQCQKISIINNALYLACKYERVNFIQELILDPRKRSAQTGLLEYQNIKINRYYDDNMLDGIRDVEELGFDKIALIGDQEMIIIGEAVNRNFLLQLNKVQNKRQNYQRVYSMDMIDLLYLPQYSTSQQSKLLVISEDSLEILTVYYNPPQLQCNFSRKQYGTAISILVAINSTSCPEYQDNQNKDKQVQKIATYRICESFYPFMIALGQKQYENRTALVILISFLLAGVSLIMACIGCGVKIRTKANAILQKLQKKLQIKKEQKKLIQKQRYSIKSI